MVKYFIKMFTSCKYLNVYYVTLHQNISQRASEQQKNIKIQRFFKMNFLKTNFLAVSH